MRDRQIERMLSRRLIPTRPLDEDTIRPLKQEQKQKTSKQKDRHTHDHFQYSSNRLTLCNSRPIQDLSASCWPTNPIHATSLWSPGKGPRKHIRCSKQLEIFIVIGPWQPSPIHSKGVVGVGRRNRGRGRAATSNMANFTTAVASGRGTGSRSG